MEARILNVLFPTILQGLQLTHQAADQFGARPQQAHLLPMRPRMEHRPVEYQQHQQPFEPGWTFAQLAADRSFMDVAAVLMPVVQAIIPPLVEQLLASAPPRPTPTRTRRTASCSSCRSCSARSRRS
ncbi:hypothetical protein ACU635_12865 [[Actinomadura] parvosata]|uniref:hypothetical protein n=1 Tax=[Actinomadura] parvosata TaxID=1955412 RepID=UPI00406C8AB4